MAQPPGSGGVAAIYEVKQIGEALVGNLMTSAGNGIVQDTGVSSTAPSFAALTLTNLPTADPHAVGAIWNNGGALAISAG